MGGKELDEQLREQTKSVDSSELSSNVLEREQTAPQMRQESKQATGRMEAKGDLTLLGFRTGTELSGKQLAREGIKFQTRNGDTTVDFPNGVEITARKVETSTITKTNDDGTHTTFEVQSGGIDVDLSKVQPQPLREKPPAGSGTIIDGKGNEIIKRNEDGSYTVANSATDFYTVYPDGSVNKETAIRSRDGKSWEVIDTNTPLGGLRPGDVVVTPQK